MSSFMERLHAEPAMRSARGTIRATVVPDAPLYRPPGLSGGVR